MKKIALITLLAFILANTAGAKELFINTDPINALVYIGEDAVGKTPLRLSAVNTESFKKLRIIKDGYDELEVEVELDEQRTQLLYYTLYSPNVDLLLSQRDKDVILNDVSAGKAPLFIRNMPNGIYQIGSDKDRITITNSEYSRLKKTTQWETITTACLFAGSLGTQMYYRGENEADTTIFFSASTLIFAGLLGYNLLKLRKISLNEKRDRAEMRAIEISKMSIEDDRDMFTSAMEYMGREYWDDAIGKFQLLINLHPDSQYISMSLYQIGNIYYTQGKYEQAEQYLRSFVLNYPSVEFYSFALYSMLDAEIQRGNVVGALTDYESLRPIYIDDPSGTLYSNFYDVYTRIYEASDKTNNQMLVDLDGELDYFINNYSDTYFYPDVLLLKGRLQYLYLDRRKGKKILTGLKEDYTQRQDLLSEVESILSGQ